MLARILAFGALTMVLAPPPAPPGRPGEAGLDTPCLASAGYSWCAATESCVRQWETPCSDNYANCAACLKAQRDGINIACPARCDVDDTEAACACPPAPPCPLVARGAPGCAAAPPAVDDCGCPGAPRGGVRRGHQWRLRRPGVRRAFEYVATMGPLVADAGDVRRPCHARRLWQLHRRGCTVWHDGCNTCRVGGTGDALACTEMLATTRPTARACRTPPSRTAGRQGRGLPPLLRGWLRGPSTARARRARAASRRPPGLTAAARRRAVASRSTGTRRRDAQNSTVKGKWSIELTGTVAHFVWGCSAYIGASRIFSARCVHWFQLSSFAERDKRE